MSSVVKIYFVDPQKNVKYFIGSGVVVTIDGIVLTAGHITFPKAEYVVVYPNGIEYRAKGKGKITKSDIGIIQMTEGQIFPFSEMGRSYDLHHGEPCVSIAYPGSLDGSIPTLRLGFIVRPNGNDRRANFLQTTCLMEPGDSGGPLFNLDGKVVGLHSNVYKDLDANFEVPIDLCLSYWDYLKQDSTFQSISGLAPKELFYSKSEPGVTNVHLSDTSASTLALFSKMDFKVYKVGNRHSLENERVLTTPIDLRLFQVDKKNKDLFLLPKVLLWVISLPFS
jgi:Trypsin-like serine proteases, typically periplasmic, contain C-terminal PDZ domain